MGSLSRWPAVKGLFFEFHVTVMALVIIDPGIPVFGVRIGIIQSVMAAEAFFSHERCLDCFADTTGKFDTVTSLPAYTRLDRFGGWPLATAMLTIPDRICFSISRLGTPPITCCFL